MRISGEWLICDDLTIRPVIPGLVQTADGSWANVTFLLDAGADRTALSANFLERLSPLKSPDEEQIRLAGVGGETGVITVETVIGFRTDEHRTIKVRGKFGVFTHYESTDISVLGRDVTNNFSVIYDYPQRIVALLALPHFYEIKRN
jgi:hypothetical protein